MPRLLEERVTAAELAALDAARGLAAAGIPVFVAYPDPKGETPSGKATGYRLPKGWQNTTANPAYVNAWKPGLALCAVMGHGLDLVDVDPRNGGDAAALPVMPVVYAEAATPSGGRHSFVASMGAGSRDGVTPGIDIKAGDEGGGGRGFAFIAPTVRVSKTTGERVAYEWITPPDAGQLAGTAADKSGHQLAEMIRQSRPARQAATGTGQPFTQPTGLKHAGPIPYGEHHTQLVAYAGSLRARRIPQHEAEALMLRRLQDCAQPPDADRPRYTEAETLALLRDIYSRYPAGDPAAETAGQPDTADDEGDLDNKGRFRVLAGNRNPIDIADDTARRILAGNEPLRLFSMGASAVVLKDGKLLPLDADGWLFYVARRVTFEMLNKDGGRRIVPPPAAAMKLIPSVVIPDLPPIDGVATIPYLDRDGNVVADDGYRPATRLVLHTGGFRVPAVPAAPGAEDVAQAVKLLTEDWLGDFPFATPADKANALAVLLTLTGRMFFALAPLFVVDASTAGSGKGVLVTTMSLIATGEPPQVMELPADGEEQRKKITSALLAGQELIMWDESHVIAGRTLAAILTAEKYSDRLLGGNKMISVVNRFTQVALGNNVEVWGDMKRRVVPSRLVPDTDHPEHRSDFRHPDLEGWVRVHRGELLAAVLTIWRNWIAKGRPDAPAGMGSFERWARTVGGALQAAGVEAFRANTTAWLSDSDDDDGWSDHLAQLRSRFGDGFFTVAQVADAVGSGYLKRPPVKQDPDKTLSQQLAYAYRKIRERWHGDLRLVRSDGRDSASGGRTWAVRQRPNPLDPGTAEPSSGWSASSAEGTDSQVTGSAGFQQPSLTIADRNASSVDADDSETAGQSGWPDDADDADHPNLTAEPWGAWPADSIGAEAGQ
jgi:hypothetical protein